LRLHRTEFGEIDLRQRRQIEADAAGCARKPRQFGFDERLHVSRRIRPLGPLPVTAPRSTPRSRASAAPKGRRESIRPSLRRPAPTPRSQGGAARGAAGCGDAGLVTAEGAAGSAAGADAATAAVAGVRGSRLRRAGFQRQHQRALRHLVTNLDLDFPDQPAAGAGIFQRRLVGLDRNQRIFSGDAVAGLHSTSVIGTSW